MAKHEKLNQFDDLNRIKYATNPYNVNRLTLAAGEAAMKENDYYMKNCQKIMDARRFTTESLEAMGFTVVPSKANFIFAKSQDMDGGTLYEKLKEKGVLVRHFTKERIKDYNRITIGTMEDMKKFVETTREILEERP